MDKNRSHRLLPALSSKLTTEHSQVKSHRYFPHPQSTIPKQEENKSQEFRECMKKWRITRRNQHLQQTYKENIRLFLSISKQKSVYHFNRRPLAPRPQNKQNLTTTLSQVKLKSKLVHSHQIVAQ